MMQHCFFLYLLDRIGSLLVCSVQFFCHLISFCLTGVTEVLFAGLSGSDYQRLKFSSTSAFDFANINLQERLSRPAMPLLRTQRAAEQTSRRSRQPRPSPFQPGSMSIFIQVQTEGSWFEANSSIFAQRRRPFWSRPCVSSCWRPRTSCLWIKRRHRCTEILW